MYTMSILWKKIKMPQQLLNLTEEQTNTPFLKGCKWFWLFFVITSPSTSTSPSASALAAVARDTVTVGTLNAGGRATYTLQKYVVFVL